MAVSWLPPLPLLENYRGNWESYFAWNYKNPVLKLGIESLKNECAIYKNKGYKYLYLGQAAEYKKIDGYEELGPI